MAEKKKTVPAGSMPKQQAKPAGKKRFRKLIKLMVALLVLIVLAGAGFGAGVYFNLVDPASIAQKFNLHKYPVIGKYMPQPATNFETVDLPPESEAVKDKPAALTPPPAATAPALPPLTATPEEIKANLAKAKQEEAKRISRLARLYGEMKPDEAVPILNRLDDSTVLAIFAKMEDSQVAKLMTQIDSKRAARLTEDMIKGGKPQTADMLKGLKTM